MGENSTSFITVEEWNIRCHYQMPHFSYLWKWILGSAKKRKSCIVEVKSSEELDEPSLLSPKVSLMWAWLFFKTMFWVLPLDFEPQVTSYWRYILGILFNFMIPLLTEFSCPSSYAFLCHFFQLFLIILHAQ